MKIEKLTPAYKDYIWGGRKLKEKYGKVSDTEPLAESWELSAHPDGLTRLSDGTPLLEAVSKAELGSALERFDRFPMLIKLIDAEQDLSVQVHPSDEYALKNENSLGKTELWYVVEAEAGAGLYVGFKEKITKDEYAAAIRQNRLCELLNFFEVKAGDCYFIPAGTVHAIGRGCLICEIQQNSNITYRVYDHGRLGKDGRPRELHIEKALAVSSLEPYSPQKYENGYLGGCEYFTSYRIDVDGAFDLPLDTKSFRAICCVAGEGKIGNEKATKGDSFFVGACKDSLSLTGKMTLIVSFVP